MTCLREQAVTGYLGDVPCDEEGCQFRLVQIGSTREASGAASEGDCVLQLRLRAGETIVDKDRVQ